MNSPFHMIYKINNNNNKLLNFNKIMKVKKKYWINQLLKLIKIKLLNKLRNQVNFKNNIQENHKKQKIQVQLQINNNKIEKNIWLFFYLMIFLRFFFSSFSLRCTIVVEELITNKY